MRSLIFTAAVAALALAACDKRPEPQGETTGAAMPDTSQSTPVPGPAQTAAPDAGDTGVVPADGSQPPMQPSPPPEKAPPAKSP
jgi:hypothetical protein